MNNTIMKLKRLALVVGDIICLYLSLFLTLGLRYGWNQASDQWGRHFWPFTLVFAIWLVVFYIGELYDIKANFSFSSLLRSLVKVFIINFLLAVVVFYFLSPLFNLQITPQRVLIINVIVSLVIIFVYRKLLLTFLKSAKTTDKILIIGKSRLSEELITEINKRPQLNLEAINLETLPADFKEFCLKNNITSVVSASDIHKDLEISQKLFDCLSWGVDVYNINRFYEKVTDKIPVEDVDYGWFLENLSSRPKLSYDLPKRILDLVIAVIAGIISLIVYPFVYLAMKIDDGGVLFSIQDRVGKNNQIIKMLKFRTMTFANDGAKWGQTENKVTRLGKFLRKSRIDELPQLWNVVRGDLSLIGPRPEWAEPVAKYAQEIPNYNLRHLIKPGLSGWAQINQEGEPHHGMDIIETRNKFSYDLYYIKNRSFWLDLRIILKTIKLLIMRKGV